MQRRLIQMVPFPLMIPPSLQIMGQSVLVKFRKGQCAVRIRKKQLATGCMSSTKAFRAMPIITICSP